MSSTHRQSQSPPLLTAAEELACMMREVTPLEDDEGTHPISASSSQRMSSPTYGTVSSADGAPPSSGPMRFIEQCAARRLADQLNLFPYQKDALAELTKVVPALLFAILLNMKVM